MHSNIKNNKNIEFKTYGELVYVEFKNLQKYSQELTHCFSTRLGGVSEGEYSSLNLSFKKDKKENVFENYKRLANALDIDFDKIVLSNQVHDNKIWIVEASDAGKGLTRKSDIIGYDGLITNVKNVPIVTFYADCVPVLMYDPVKKVIAALHSGWKSTLKNISLEAINIMQQKFGCDVRDIEVAIGPSICQNCFEVDADVYNSFLEKFCWSNKFTKHKGDKYYIDLQHIINQVLIENGIAAQNILISNVCTKCNNDIFYSYRGDDRKTGSLVAVMMLR